MYDLHPTDMEEETLKEKSIKLRKNGMTYSEILQEVSVAKSTLSLWLRSVGLSKIQKQKITAKRIAARLRAVEAVRQKRIIRSSLIDKSARREVADLIKNPLWLVGVVLYWAEGSKQKEWNPSQKVVFTNMDAETIRIFKRWIGKYFPKNSIKYELYIHPNSTISKSVKFWSEKLGIKGNNIKVYFKKPNKNPGRGNIKTEYNGVMKLVVSKSTDLNRKIAGWTGGVIEYLC